jgi:hypothetical protein
MPRTKSQSASIQGQRAERRIKEWADKHQVPCATEGKALSALRGLLKTGFSLSQLILVLELLRGYVDNRAFEKAKRNHERRANKSKSLARRLRSIAPAARELLWALDREFVESLTQTAENLEPYPSIVSSIVLDDAFGRSLAGTTRFLFLATALTEEITSRPHYQELTDLLACISSAIPTVPRSRQKVSEDIRKTVTRFRQREPGFVEDLLAEGLEKAATALLNQWHSAQRRQDRAIAKTKVGPRNKLLLSMKEKTENDKTENQQSAANTVSSTHK